MEEDLVIRDIWLKRKSKRDLSCILKLYQFYYVDEMMHACLLQKWKQCALLTRRRASFKKNEQKAGKSILQDLFLVQPPYTPIFFYLSSISRLPLQCLLGLTFNYSSMETSFPKSQILSFIEHKYEIPS